ncbi:hypothetical protein C8F01DRAFT_1320810 [Mycena amicta]|nr:hypothetical protein C8F01DRAFT_1320810 [Mycena amicta]
MDRKTQRGSEENDSEESDSKGNPIARETIHTSSKAKFGSFERRMGEGNAPPEDTKCRDVYLDAILNIVYFFDTARSFSKEVISKILFEPDHEMLRPDVIPWSTRLRMPLVANIRQQTGILIRQRSLIKPADGLCMQEGIICAGSHRLDRTHTLAGREAQQIFEHQVCDEEEEPVADHAFRDWDGSEGSYQEGHCELECANAQRWYLDGLTRMAHNKIEFTWERLRGGHGPKAAPTETTVPLMEVWERNDGFSAGNFQLSATVLSEYRANVGVSRSSETVASTERSDSTL